MIIEDQDFKIEKIKSGEFYNLSFLKIINEGKENERKEFEIVGYGMPIDKCIKRVVDYRLRDESGNYTIKEYLDRYKDIVEDIAKLIEE